MKPTDLIPIPNKGSSMPVYEHIPAAVVIISLLILASAIIALILIAYGWKHYKHTSLLKNEKLPGIAGAAERMDARTRRLEQLLYEYCHDTIPDQNFFLMKEILFTLYGKISPTTDNYIERLGAAKLTESVILCMKEHCPGSLLFNGNCLQIMYDILNKERIDTDPFGVPVVSELSDIASKANGDAYRTYQEYCTLNEQRSAALFYAKYIIAQYAFYVPAKPAED